MTWPPPSSTPPPPSAAPSSGDSDRRRSPIRELLSIVTPAAWVAVVGGAFVLLAAAIVVVGNWDAIGRSVRLAGLSLGTVGLLAASERLRRAVPTTASIIGHVGTFLTATVGIAAMSVAGFTWPACLAAGGAIAIVATQIQMSRWPRGAFGAGQVGAIALAATGVGALTGTTGGLLAGIAATGLLAMRAHRRAAALALVAVCSPALAALAEAGIGAGTFARAGLVGERLSWSGPVVGVLAALVLGTIAMQRRNNGLMVTAALAPLLGAVTGLAAIDGSNVAWLCLPGFVVIAAELTWWILPGEAMRRQIRGVIDALAATLAVLTTLFAPGIGISFDSGLDATASAAVPLTVAIIGLALAITRWRADGRRLVDLGLAGLAVGAIGVCIALDIGELAVACVAVAVTIAAGWTSRTFGPIAVYAPAVWAAVAITEIGRPESSGLPLTSFVLLAVLTSFVVLVRARLAGGNRWVGPVELLGVVAIVGAVAAEVAHELPTLATVIAISLTSGAFMLAERRFVPWAAVIMSITLALSALPAAFADEFGTLWIGALVATTALAAAWLVHRSPLAAHMAAGGAALTAAMSLVGTSVTADQFYLLALVAAVVSTGLALLVGRSTPIDSVAATASVLMLLGSWATTHESWVSLAWIAIGLQLAVIGLTRDRLALAAIGTPALVGGLISLWFTSGWNELLSGWLAPADIRVGDLWMAAATIAALVTGIVVRRSNDTNSWIAFGPALAIAATWLLPVQADRATDWALPLALAIGFAAIAAGAARRYAGPLVGGIALTGASAFLALGSDISAVPAWVWFGLGGLALLATATAIERSSRDETSLRDLAERWS